MGMIKQIYCENLDFTLLNQLIRGSVLFPILNSFQQTVNQYNIEWDLIETSLESMKMELNPEISNQAYYEKYILCFAEVLELMYLHIFKEGDKEFA